MSPLVVIAAGIVAVALGTLLLRAYGPRVRVGRLLAVTPAVPIAEARALAEAGRRAFVRVDGRLDADDDFPDENARPLVFRRRRVEARRGSGWQVLDERRETVPFRVRQDLDEIDIDADALDAGLVTLVREASGTAAEAGAGIPPTVLAGVAPATPVRLRVEQLSSVEHATVLGVPITGADGRVTMTAGTGRPLVVSTLKRDEAMRVLAEGGRARPLAAAASLGGGLALLALGMGWALVAGGFG